MGANLLITKTVLPLGNYEVKAEAKGFSATVETVSVEASVSNLVDIVLNVSGVNPNEVAVSATGGEQVITNDNSATTGSFDYGTFTRTASGRQPHGFRNSANRQFDERRHR